MSILDLQDEQSPIEIQQLKSRMYQVQQSLLSDTPGLPEALAEIHKNLLQHEELVHLLDDDDIARIHQGFEKFKQFTLVQKEVKANNKPKKKLSNDDLANL